MNKFRFLRNVALTKLLVLSPFFSSISADDTEIFFNISREVSAPNILFVLDDSGSMSSLEASATNDYDPDVDYEGSFSDERIYYFRFGIRYPNYRHYVERDVIECSDIFTKIDGIGFTSPYKMSFNFGNAWYSFTRFDVENLRTVCEADGNTEPDWSDITPQTFYSGNYLNWYFNVREVVTESRLSILKRVTKNLADGLENVNLGLMSFDWNNSRNEGGVIREAVRPLSEGRADFKNAVDDLNAAGNTPVAETLFGAKRYFEGGSPFLTDARDQARNSVSGGSYVSPIDLECQANYVVVLSDGQPTQDTNNNSDMQRELGIDDCDGNCLDDIAEYMYTNDISTDYDGIQRVVTYTVGFNSDPTNLDQTLLEEAARKGGGEYYAAQSADQLTEVFTDIFRQVLSTNSTFSAPGVSVNNFNQLNFLDALYYSVFEPVLDPVWPGNLKRYRLTAEGKIVDVNGNDAVDPATGFFRDTAQSFWSPIVDGAVAGRGGAASVIADSNSERKVYTHYEGSLSQSLTNAANVLSTANESLTKAMFGDADMTDERFQRLINWTRGADVFDEDGDGSRTDSRKFVADPLHSRPFLQVYGGTEEEPDTTVFFGDNQGFLHALDGETGEFNFSFMPAELLENQATYMDNTRGDGPRPYGMDGSVVAWFKDIDGDRVVDADEDKVYVYSGMRRGGRNYYGLDVTDRNSPSVLWTIRGGSGDFAELGQTWSDAVKQRVRIGDDIKDVLFFSGGYDTNQDNVVVRTEDTMGRALYMVDATTGERLWWAGPANSGANLELASMDYSIPATPAVIDLNRDGLADQLYVGDMGGQIWRVDFSNGQEADSFATAGVIANLAGGDEASNRRFYHTPDLSGTLKNGQRYLNLAIGSGYQASPLDKDVEDRFYKLTISPVGIPLNEDGDVEYTTLTESDLFDTTDNLIQEGTDEQRDAAETSLAQAQGWYIRLTRDGEKVLSASTTLRGDVFFTTFEPAASLDPCVPSAGQSRLYHVELADGRAVVNYDKLGSDDALTETDRYVALKTLGLPPSPKAITIDGEDIIVAGTETLVPPPPGGLVRKIYWYEE
jgi:type IV pilus assembly protein PilY1